MPRQKLSKGDRRKIVELKRRCPCITYPTLAYVFDISPARVGEIIRASESKSKTELKK